MRCVTLVGLSDLTDLHIGIFMAAGMMLPIVYTGLIRPRKHYDQRSPSRRLSTYLTISSIFHHTPIGSTEHLYRNPCARTPSSVRRDWL